MLSRILFLSLLFISSALAEEVCKDGQIKYVEKQKEIIKNVKFCKNKNVEQANIYSVNCSKKECSFLKEPFKRPVDLRRYASTMGSAGFKVCRELKGSPQIVQYKFNSDKYWDDDSRCIVDKNTFVSNSILLDIWKDFILK